MKKKDIYIISNPMNFLIKYLNQKCLFQKDFFCPKVSAIRIPFFYFLYFQYIFVLLIDSIIKMLENVIFSRSWCSLAPLMCSLTQNVHLEKKERNLKL